MTSLVKSWLRTLYHGRHSGEEASYSRMQCLLSAFGVCHISRQAKAVVSKHSHVDLPINGRDAAVAEGHPT